MEIHGDVEGLRELIRSLTRVPGAGEHDHLMTPSRGGTELSEEPQEEGSKLVNRSRSGSGGADRGDCLDHSKGVVRRGDADPDPATTYARDSPGPNLMGR